MPPTTPRAARTVALNPQSGLDRYQGFLGDATPARSYKLQLTQRSSLNLALSNLKANADLALVDRSGKVIDRSARSGRNAESIAQTLDSGTYYVRVNRQQGKTSYQLNVDLGLAATPTTATQATATQATATQATATTQATVTTPVSLADQVLALVNQQRGVAGAKPLKLNAKLTAAAEEHSQDMALNDYLEHTSLDGRSPEARILASGYDAFTSSENVAGGLATPESVVQAWMASPGHRANILNPRLTEMGVGCYFLENDLGSTNYRYYWTQDFGQPMF